jgi:hypothetical protein
MSLADLLGRFWTLPIRRFGAPGAFLALYPDDERSGVDPDEPVVLLPGSEIPPGARPGDEVDVFLYLDSEDRPVATTRAPRLELGEVTFLEVTALTRIGAFFDWGLPKELLVPFAQQTTDLRVGDRHPIGLYLDSSGRLSGTMRVSELLETDAADFELDEWVEGEAWRNDPGIGLFVIVERGFVGLVPRDEPHGLRRGQAARFRVASLLEDGKMELSLRGHAHEEIGRDGDRILAVLSARNAPRVGDRTRPEDIRRLFGLSKKAFKRAVGGLLKRGAVRLDEAGFVVVADPSGGR